MEYRRRRRSRRSRSRNRGGDSASGAGALLLAVLLFAGVVYFVSASSTGNWLVQNVVAPIFGSKASPTPTTENGGTDKTGSVAVKDLEYYAVQLGVFSSEGNAKSLGQEVMAKGAAGYTFFDGTKYRVFACAFPNEASALSVKENLKSSGYECLVFPIKLEASTIDVTAPEDQITKMNEIILAMRSCVDKIGEISLPFDKDKQTVEQGKEAVTAAFNDIAAIGNIVSFHAVPEAQLVGGAYDVFVTAMKKLSEQNYSDTVAFSANIKYTQLQLIYQYMVLSGELSSAG